MARAAERTGVEADEPGRPAAWTPATVVWRAFYWTYDRATWQYDLWVIAILAFVWLTPPDWLGDPTANGPGLIGIVRGWFR
jgi:hypothetical protein